MRMIKTLKQIKPALKPGNKVREIGMKTHLIWYLKYKNLFPVAMEHKGITFSMAGPIHNSKDEVRLLNGVGHWLC